MHNNYSVIIIVNNDNANNGNNIIVCAHTVILQPVLASSPCRS